VELAAGALNLLSCSSRGCRTLQGTAALLFASTGFAFAEDATTVIGTSPFVEHVPYRVADLATASGVRDLRSRVRHAARRLCAPTDETLMATFSELNCTSPALRDAFAQVDSAVMRWRSGALASAGSITIRVR
jgi:UrcA family protein